MSVYSENELMDCQFATQMILELTHGIIGFSDNEVTELHESELLEAVTGVEKLQEAQEADAAREESKVKVRFQRHTRLGATLHDAGSTAEVDDDVATRLLKHGRVMILDEASPKPKNAR